MSEVKQVKKKKKGKILPKVIGIFLIIVSIVILGNVGMRIRNIALLKQQADIVEEELQKIKDENAILHDTKNKLEDPNYVKTFARGEYMFSTSDEKVFYLPSNNESEE